MYGRYSDFRHLVRKEAAKAKRKVDDGEAGGFSDRSRQTDDGAGRCTTTCRSNLCRVPKSQLHNIEP